ncbi:HAD-IC family P-type ATPase [uncultured Corynebacterium sp.]|uniref:HAD-IC family P-type ATPase n=1 Tax=uncultured Corynebacterium sp. TaxID=159447 RepID=UPI0025CE81C1|nr:HAD-IC family P-type ATPase [uncultured Corynebacterium sp.]
MSEVQLDDAAFVTGAAGLTSAQVEERRRAGKVNDLPPTSGRSVADIIRANVFTRINAILAVLLAIVLWTGSWVNGAFGLLIIANSIVGVVQELRAKRTLDKLSIVGRARPMVIRDGEPARELDREDIVVDDLIELGAGDQIIVDGVARSVDGLDVDESPLTGESKPVHKSIGDPLYSGSHVVSGGGAQQALKVGVEAYAAQLTAEAGKFTLTDSELLGGINKILRVITWILIPTGALVIWTQLFRSGQPLREALLAMVASLVPMVPEGLVLMMSIAFAIGIVRLGKRRVLTNELPAIEGLARVDVVCVDKTGTLTENRMHLREVIPLDDEGPGEEHVFTVLAALGTLEERPNSTTIAINEGLADRSVDAPGWTPVDKAPFTSARKWAGATFDGHGTWVLGAPDVLAATGSPALERASELMAGGLRVLLLARAEVATVSDVGIGPDEPVEKHPGTLTPVALAVLDQTLRPDARDTLDYFARENVRVKVISGDNAAAVGAVGRSLDLPGADRPVDARTLPDPRAGEEEEEAFATAVEEGHVFGRVTAEQKRAMVRALQSRGHVVAMTGDGVNDVLALKDANIGVAMGAGAPATRSVAQLVLLDDEFAQMPHVVAEGRRVIGNIERVANLFLTKTIYSVFLALAVGVIGFKYPFEPIHVTITGWFTIGIPAFVLSLAPNHERAKPGFSSRVFRLALPSGLIVGALTFIFWFWAYPGGGVSDEEIGAASTATLVVLIISAFWVLAVVARPYEPWKLGLLAVAGGAYFVIFLVEPVARLLHLHPVPPNLGVPAVVFGIVGAVLVEAVWQFNRKRGSRVEPATVNKN